MNETQSDKPTTHLRLDGKVGYYWFPLPGMAQGAIVLPVGFTTTDLDYARKVLDLFQDVAESPKE